MCAMFLQCQTWISEFELVNNDDDDMINYYILIISYSEWHCLRIPSKGKYVAVEKFVCVLNE